MPKIIEDSFSDPPLNSAERQRHSSLTVDSVSLKGIEYNLSILAIQEEDLANQLKDLVDSERQLSQQLGSLDVIRVQVASQAIAARTIRRDLLSDAATIAGRVSSAVKGLDLEQSRVKSTLAVVEQVAELKACVLGVTGSMGAPQDWEMAASYLSRAWEIPKEVVCGSFAEEVVPTADVPDPPSVTLDNAAQSLQGLFLREFEKAAQEGNSAKVTRFFKLFPLIGRPEVGLEAYGRYVCQGVASRARNSLDPGLAESPSKDGIFYATAFTRLFEHLAQIIEHHGALVQQHYGSESMVKVIERLQREADTQGGIILDAWTEERNIERKLTDIRSYAFTFLVQSFLPTSNPLGTTPSSRLAANRGVEDNSAKDIDPIDMKLVDSHISEMSVMLGRWSLYTSFITHKCALFCHTEPQIPKVISDSELRKRISDRLISPFSTMATFFFRRSVEKAFQLDEQPPDLSLDLKRSLPTNPPYITSAVDDIMYIVNQILEKSLSTSQKSVLTNVVPTVARILSSDFIGMIQRKMRDEYYPRGAVQGALPPEQTVITFIILLNNLDIAVEYVERIVKNRLGKTRNVDNGRDEHMKSDLAASFPLERDAAVVAAALKSLRDTFDQKANELISDGVFVLFKNVVKPRLRPIVAEAFRNADYQKSQNEVEESKIYADSDGDYSANADALVPTAFEGGWKQLINPLTRIATDRNSNKLLPLAVSHLAELLEKRIWAYFGRIDGVGGVRLERDILGIVNVVTRDGNYGLRTIFTRCTEICLIMNLEHEEWEDMSRLSKTDPASSKWQLNEDERARARLITLDYAAKD